MSKKNKKKASRKRNAAVQAATIAASAVSPETDENESGADVADSETGARRMWSLVPVGLLIFLISSPAIVGPYGQKGGYTPDLHMAAYIQVGALVLLSLFFLTGFSRSRIVVPRSPVLLPLLLFYGWAMLSVLWADTKYEAVVDALDWTGAFLCALLIVLLLRDIKVLKTLLFCVLVSGLLMALLGIGQYLFGIDWVQQHVVPAATFSNKNMAGQYGVLTLPITMAFFMYSRSNLKVWFFGIVAALIMTYIFYTRSRGAWIGLMTEVVIFMALIVYLKVKHDHHFFGGLLSKKIALAASLALFVGMSFLTPSMFDRTEEVMAASIGAKPEILEAEHGGKVLKKVANFSGSAETRTTMWANSIPMFKDNFLIGVGLGNWTIHYAAYQSWFKPDQSLLNNKYHANAHNDYIEILCELGVIGFALFVWLVISLFRLIGRLLSDHHEVYFLLTMAIILAMMGIAVNAVFSFPLKQPVPIFMMMVYIAVLSNLYGNVVETKPAHVMRMPPMPVTALIAVVFIVATVGLVSLHINWYQSEIHYRNAVIGLQKSRYRNAYTEAKLAYKLNPLRANLLWIEATALMQTGREESRSAVIEKLEKVDRARPYSSSTLLNLVSAYGRAGRHQEAAEAMGRLVSVQPDNEKIKFRYGVLLMNTGRYEEALEALKVARKYSGAHARHLGRELQKEVQERQSNDYVPTRSLRLLKKSTAEARAKLNKIKQMIQVAESEVEKKKASAAPADTP